MCMKRYVLPIPEYAYPNGSLPWTGYEYGCFCDTNLCNNVVNLKPLCNWVWIIMNIGILVLNNFKTLLISF